MAVLNLGGVIVGQDQSPGETTDQPYVTDKPKDTAQPKETDKPKEMDLTTYALIDKVIDLCLDPDHCDIRRKQKGSW
nr:hypothetical protein BaRGS_013232 [Batillaria attramentaria]